MVEYNVSDSVLYIDVDFLSKRYWHILPIFVGWSRLRCVATHSTLTIDVSPLLKHCHNVGWSWLQGHYHRIYLKHWHQPILGQDNPSKFIISNLGLHQLAVATSLPPRTENWPRGCVGIGIVISIKILRPRQLIRRLSDLDPKDMDGRQLRLLIHLYGIRQ